LIATQEDRWFVVRGALGRELYLRTGRFCADVPPVGQGQDAMNGFYAGEIGWKVRQNDDGGLQGETCHIRRSFAKERRKPLLTNVLRQSWAILRV